VGDPRRSRDEYPMIPPEAPDLSTKLAIERTRLAHERTLMAWVRTATSLISFGFTVYKFFEYLRESQGGPPGGAIGPREFGGAMIAIGIAALVLATLGHRRSMRTLRAEYGPLIPNSLSTVVAGLVGAVGIVLLISVLLRM
jgi:putative membrane protein